MISGEKDFVCCRLGSMLIGIDLSRVQEINRQTAATFVPLVEPYVRGLINLRGSLVTVLDLGVIVRGEATAESNKARTVVLEMGEEVHGLVVGEVGDVITVDHAKVEPLPSHVPAAQRRWFTGMLQLANELLLLLDVNAVGQLNGPIPSLA
ncbi:MAG: chemotaxis protein CheW [Planctomycetes bacterium]|nr:chemotaxis protein CheW [Planctomycetota bacterium]